MSFFFGVLFAIITLLAIGLQRTYYHYPVKELKRRARNGDQLAQMLYKPVSYGVSLQVLLWSIVIISSAISFVLFSQALAPWFAIILIAFLIWLGFLWLPSSRLTVVSTRIAALLTPAISWLLNYLYPVLERIAGFFRKHKHLNIRTNLYEKEDIIDLLDRQRDLPDNRIAIHDIDLLQHVLQFSDKHISDVYVPLRALQVVNISEAIGPKLMDDLYKSGYSRFPVYDGEKTNIVATLYMKDLVKKKASGHVKDVARSEVYYVHEDFTLQQALQAFLKTKHHLFIVVNSFEEFVGIVTIEDVLEQLIGRQIVDEFDQYENMRAVAAAAALKEHTHHKKTEAEPTVEPEAEITDSETPDIVVK